MIFSLFRFILLGLFLSSCGGGGGGGGSSAPIGVGTVSSSVASSSSSVTTLPSEVTFVFPKKNATVDSDYVTVTGIATNPNGVTAVSVNGQGAIFTDKNPGAKTLNWSASVPLSVGDNPLKIEVRDGSGRNTQVDSESLSLKRNLYPPQTFVKDVAHNRLIGNYSESYKPISVAVDITSGNITKLPITFSHIDYGQMNAAGTTIYSSELSPNGQLMVYSVDVNSGLAAVEQKTDLVIGNGLSIVGATYAPDLNTYFIAVAIYSNVGVRSKIYQYKISTSELSLFTETDLLETPVDITYVAGSLFFLSQSSGQQNLFVIDTKTAQRETLFSDSEYSRRLVIDDNKEYAYFIGYDDIVKIRLSDFQSEKISNEADQNIYLLRQIGSVFFDNTGKKLLIGNISSIITVDINDGKRGMLAEAGVGKGLKLNVSRDITLTLDKKWVYVSDLGQLIKINLETGDRTLVTRMIIDGSPRGISAIALDEAHNRMFLSLSSAIVELNLTDNSYKVIASTTEGLGAVLQSYDTLAYDDKNNRLITSSYYDIAIIQISVDTYKRSLLYNTDPAGTPAYKYIKLSPKNNQLFLGNPILKKISSINMETGEAKDILTGCNDEYGENKISDAQFDYNESTNKFLIVGDRFAEYDPEKNKCKSLYWFNRGYSFRYLDNENLLSTSDGLEEVNINSGQRIVISR